MGLYSDSPSPGPLVWRAFLLAATTGSGAAQEGSVSSIVRRRLELVTSHTAGEDGVRSVLRRATHAICSLDPDWPLFSSLGGDHHHCGQKNGSEQASSRWEHPHMDVSSRLCPSLLEKLNHWVKRKNNSNQPKRNIVLTTRQIL